MTEMPVDWLERSVRPALGVDLYDTFYGQVPHPLQVALEGFERFARVRIERHDSGRYVLLQSALFALPAGGFRSIGVRIFDRLERWAPRRLSVPLAARPRRVDAMVFPGPGFEVSSRATGIRGRVTSSGVAMPWARLVARRGIDVVGRAQADHRGEYLLLIAPGADLSGEATASTLLLDVVASGPTEAPALDGLRHGSVPLEPVTFSADPGLVELPDAAGREVLDGLTLPEGFVATASAEIVFDVGRVISVDDLDLVNP